MTMLAPHAPLFADRVFRIGTEAAFAFGALIREAEARQALADEMEIILSRGPDWVKFAPNHTALCL